MNKTEALVIPHFLYRTSELTGPYSIRPQTDHPTRLRDGAERRLAPVATEPDESLVVDDRYGQSPARAVEQRLTNRLSGSSVPASMLQVKAMLKDR